MTSNLIHSRKLESNCAEPLQASQALAESSLDAVAVRELCLEVRTPQLRPWKAQQLLLLKQSPWRGAADPGPLIWVSPRLLCGVTTAEGVQPSAPRGVAFPVKEVLASLGGLLPTGRGVSLWPPPGLFRTCLCPVNMEVLMVHVERCHFLFIKQRKYFYCLS